MRSSLFVSHKQLAGWLSFAILLALLTASTSQLLAQVTVTCPADMTVSNDPGLCSAVVDFPDPIVTGTNANDVVTIIPPSGSTFPVGSNEVSVTVMEGSTNVADCSFTITVEDMEPPVITNVSVSRPTLWPPNHKMVNVTVSYEDTDNCDSTPDCSLSVTSNEPANGIGDGNTSTDWQVVDAHHVRLRAERSGKGDGRTYTITITCTDQSGNSSSADVTVLVPHDRGKGAGHQGNNAGGNGNGHAYGRTK